LLAFGALLISCHQKFILQTLWSRLLAALLLLLRLISSGLHTYHSLFDILACIRSCCFCFFITIPLFLVWHTNQLLETTTLLVFVLPKDEGFTTATKATIEQILLHPF
jgi:hypothetical protein